MKSVRTLYKLVFDDYNGIFTVLNDALEEAQRSIRLTGMPSVFSITTIPLFHEDWKTAEAVWVAAGEDHDCETREQYFRTKGAAMEWASTMLYDEIRINVYHIHD